MGEVFYMNISSLMAHVEEVHEFVLRKKTLMLLLSETCLTKEITENEIECEGYVCYRNDSHSRHTGGCCIYVRDDLKPEIFNSPTLDGKVWILSVKVFNNGCEYVCTAVYFARNGGKKTCIEYFDNWCEQYIYEANRQVVCGDFNADLLKYGTYQSKIKQVIESHGMKQFVKQATRITEHSRTKIDLVMSNLVVEAEVLTTNKLSDHSTVEIKIDGLVREKEKHKTVRRFVDYEPEVLRQRLNEFDWESIMDVSLNLVKKRTF